MNDSTTEEMRARFERFASDHGKWPGAVVRSGDAYKLMNTHIQWVAWQAAYADSIEPAQPADSGRVELERWGLPDATRMAKRCEDGYWTPWHVAQAAVDALTAQGQGDAVALMSVTDDVTPVLQPLEGWRNLPNRNYTLYTAQPLAAQGQGEVYQCPECGTGMQFDPTAKPAPPAGVQDATEVHAYLPPGYRMATRDGDYWPLFGDAYCTNHAFPTRELAALEAWKQAHKKLNDSMDSIRRFAAAPSAHEGESA
jgi:hypothetical protein